MTSINNGDGGRMGNKSIVYFIDCSLMEMEIDLRTVDGNKKKTPSQQSNSARFDNEGKWP